MRNWRLERIAGPVLCLAIVAVAAADTGDKGVAAIVNGKAISMADVDAKAMADNMKLAQQVYDARKSALDDLIIEQLLAPEAAKQGKTVKALKAEKLAALQTPVTDQDVQDFFNKNKSRMRGRTLDQVKGQIKNYLAGQRGPEARNKLLAELKKDATIKIVFDVPRADIAVSANEPARGPANAPVTIVEYSDFQCPFCSRAVSTVEQVEKAYGDKVRVVFRCFPLAMHNRAKFAANAAECANDQGKFWPYHDKLFANQRNLKDEDLKKYAADLGLDTKQFDACYDAKTHESEIEATIAGGSRLGVTGTPAFFINGRFLSGAQPFDSFKNIIDDELSR